ncbi:Stealth CR1 domain-containing protein [Pediococcus acidilactici]|nr:Stealth CR1 domain-containing protein [Pediococcus acidilactici]AZP90300.1 capsule biosynthesis protein CapG [Pediococcus acidilactici]KRN15222.1 capsular polysaccharide phosphotransferase WcwK [Pediococcus acidilactici]MBW9300938.1 capsule biosynthesis protein CapG [Pediococcus acidilactici]MCQ0050426.1 capsule biosynthesis protein CapG [Pediococcus acidilactici]MCQ0052489.1 capsule biosynthesis protein CapG [Pediococcus acidilactici]
MADIDFVVTWVDFDDPKWRSKYTKYKPGNTSTMNNSTRYKDYGTFKYWFRSVEKYAPWVRNIFLITDDQVPEWLNTKNKKIKLINHSEYIDKKFLPTFNSNVIELNIGNIKELSNQFVLFNDDCFLNDFVSEEDFFRNGLPVDMGTFQPLIPDSEFSHIVLNDMVLINEWFKKKDILKKNFKKYFSLKYGVRRLISAATTLPFNELVGFYDGHLPTPYLKKTYTEVVEKAAKQVQKTNENNFRKSSDINHWLIRYYEYCTGKFIPRNSDFGCFFELSDYKKFRSSIEQSKHKMVCINDIDDEIAERGKEVLRESLAKKFPQKSSFEI